VRAGARTYTVSSMLSWDTLLDAAYTLDNLPFSPSSLAKRARDDFFAKQKKSAAADPRWSAIEELRQTGNGTVLLLSDDLDIADWAEQDEIEERITPKPVWLPLARKLEGARLARLVGAIKRDTQRARRGWADRDTYGLDQHLCGVLGAMLVHLAQEGCGYPGTEEFPTPELWNQALQENGQALLSYSTGRDEELLNKWHALAISREADEEDREVAFDQMQADDAARYANAQQALHWVADHLGSLWD